MSINTMETYVSVVLWSTVIMMSTMTSIFDLKTHAIDFSNAFAQDKKKLSPIYMAFPPGVGVNSDGSLMLNKILHVRVESPRI